MPDVTNTYTLRKFSDYITQRALDPVTVNLVGDTT